MLILVRFSALTAALCACFIVLVRFVGQAQPPAPQLAALHLDQCALPCWLNIQPGVTRFDEAIQRVTATNPGSLFTSAYEMSVRAAYQVNAALLQVGIYADEAGIVSSISIITANLERMTLGDVLAYAGAPACLKPLHSYAVYTTATMEALVIGAGGAGKWNLWSALNNITIRPLDANQSPCAPPIN